MSADAVAGESLPRLCCLEKGPNGYGFHLHGEKGKVGQFIRLVEPDSPAEKSGLLAGDRLVEVNGENVEKETHQQVVSRIRAALNSVRLLVVDPETDEHFKKLGVPVREELLRAQEKSEQAEPLVAADTQEAGNQSEAEKSRLERVSAGWAGYIYMTRIPERLGRPVRPALSEMRAARRKRLPPSDSRAFAVSKANFGLLYATPSPCPGWLGSGAPLRPAPPVSFNFEEAAQKNSVPFPAPIPWIPAPQPGLCPGLPLPATKLSLS